MLNNDEHISGSVYADDLLENILVNHHSNAPRHCPATPLPASGSREAGHNRSFFHKMWESNRIAA